MGALPGGRPTLSPSQRLAAFEAAIKDPIPWLAFVKTQDEHDKQNPIKRLPVAEKPYLVALARLWKQEQNLLIPKSRQLMATWLMVALFAHDAAYNRGRREFFVSKKEVDADALVRRAVVVLNNLPRELRPRVEYSYCRLRLEPSGSEIVGLPSGADQIRSYTASGVFFDEFAFQDRQEEAHAAVDPTVKGGGKFVGCSSSNGKNYWYELVKPPLSEGRMQRPMPGLSLYRNDAGVLVARLHYTADPVKRTEEWLRGAQVGVTPRAWRREMEISYEEYAGKPVFPEFDRHRQVRVIGRIFDGPVIRGWDFGFHRPRVVFSQLVDGVWYVQRGYGREDVGIRAFGAAVADYSAATFGAGREYEDFCDPAGLQKSDKSERTSVEILNDLEIYPSCKPGPIQKGLEVMRSMMPHRLVVDESAKQVVDALAGGYRYGEDTTARGAEVPEKDGVFDDWMDALRYAMVGKLELQKERPAAPPEQERGQMTVRELLRYHREQQDEGGESTDLLYEDES